MSDAEELAVRNVTVKVFAQAFNHETGAMQLFEFDAGEIDLDVNDETNIDTLIVKGHLSRHQQFEEKPGGE